MTKIEFFTKTSKKSIFELCNIFGPITSIQEEINSMIVEFVTNDHALRLAKVLNMQNKIKFVIISPCRSVFIDRVPLRIDSKTILKSFSKYGKIEKIVKEREYFNFKTYKIEFAREKEALKFISKNNRIFRFHPDEEALIVKPYNEDIFKTIIGVDEKSDEKCVFLYNLPIEFTDKELFDLFCVYGAIKSFGVSNQKGFVNFENELSALKAVKYSDRLEIKGFKILAILKSQKPKRNK